MLRRASRLTLLTMTIQREHILDAACRCYVDDGVAGVSMRGLARALGVTAPALYRHFASKEEVMVGVVSEAYGRMAQYLHRALEGPTALARFRMAGEAYLNFALEHPRLYLTMYAGPSFLGLQDIPEEVAQRGCAIGQFWNDRVRECVQDGYLKPGSPDEIGTTMWAHAHGLLSIYLRGILPISEAEFRREFDASFWRMMVGLGTPRFDEAWAGLAREDVDSVALTP